MQPLRNTQSVHTSKSSLASGLLFHYYYYYYNDNRPDHPLPQHHARHHRHGFPPVDHRSRRPPKPPYPSQSPLPPPRRHHPLAPTNPHPHAVRLRKCLLPLSEAPERAHVDAVRPHLLLPQGPARGRRLGHQVWRPAARHGARDWAADAHGS